MKYLKSGLALLLIAAMLTLSSCRDSGGSGTYSGGFDSTGTSSEYSSDITSSDTNKQKDKNSKTDSGSSSKTSSKNSSKTSSKDSSKTSSKNSSKTSSNTSSKTDTHVHNYIGATCTAAGKCSCGAVGSPLGHNFTAATCTVPSTCTRCRLTSGGALGHSYSGGRCVRCGDTNGPLSPWEASLFYNRLSDEENAQALAVARNLAAQVNNAGGTDFDRIYMAARLVANEYRKGAHVESGNYYHTAYGVFIKRESSCAGCSRALGLVLTLLGYSWHHVNENQWSHQWVTVNVGGTTIWADGQIGQAGTGTYPYANVIS